MIKLEVGKTYLTRDGRRAMVVAKINNREEDNYRVHALQNEKDEWLSKEDGFHHSLNGRVDCDVDLISEAV